MISPLFVRALLIVFVTILILGAIVLIKGKISERMYRANEVEQTFAMQTSGSQRVAGPFLMLTCERRGREIQAECPTQIFVPKSLRIDTDMPVDVIYRGIYPIRLYKAAMHLSGKFEWPANAPQETPYATSSWKQAYLVVAVSDPRGIKGLSLASGTPIDGRFAIHHDLGPYAQHKAGEAVPFDFTLQLVGTTRLEFAPVADTNDFRATSSWPHPAFQGGWTPDERTVTDKGFEARWRITSQAVGGETIWQAAFRDGALFQGNVGTSGAQRAAADVGVAIINPLDVYSLSFRATQYAFLFLLFTFSALALTEVLAGVRLHAIQYLLVGSALAVFFLLLIALSEHITFARAYLVASTACVTLLTIYLRHPLETLPRTAGFFAMFATLYGTLYVLLQSEDHAMLMGSLLVFGVLSLTMLATRRTDWSEVSKRMRSPAPSAA